MAAGAGPAGAKAAAMAAVSGVAGVAVAGNQGAKGAGTGGDAAGVGGGAGRGGRGWGEGAGRRGAGVGGGARGGGAGVGERTGGGGGGGLACAHCGSTDAHDAAVRTLKECAGCRSVAYCSKTCQLDAWKEHKPACRAAKAARDAATEAWAAGAHTRPPFTSTSARVVGYIGWF